jgi:hypothetical protein
VSRPSRKSALSDPKDVGAEYARQRSQLAELRGRVKVARAQQEAAIRETAANALLEHRDRLDKYLTRARISLARMLDPAVAEQVQP